MRRTSDIVRDWLAFYQRTRGVGHTHAVQKIAQEMGATIVDSHFSGQVGKTMRYNSSPCGLSGPVVWDNSAIIELFTRFLDDLKGIPEEDSGECEWNSRVCALLQEYCSTGYINDFIVRDLLEEVETEKTE